MFKHNIVTQNLVTQISCNKRDTKGHQILFCRLVGKADISKEYNPTFDENWVYICGRKYAAAVFNWDWIAASL